MNNEEDPNFISTHQKPRTMSGQIYRAGLSGLPIRTFKGLQRGQIKIVREDVPAIGEDKPAVARGIYCHPLDLDKVRASLAGPHDAEPVPRIDP